MNLSQPSGDYRYRRYFTNIGQLYRQKKVRVYTKTVLSIFMIAFFLFFAIKPAAVTIAGLVKKINDQKLVLEKLEKKVQALTQARKNYLDIQTDLYLVEQALPTKPEISYFIKELETLTRQADINLNTAQFGQVTLKEKETDPQKTPKEISFNLTTSADYQKLKNFLQILGSLRRTVLVNAFGFGTSKKEEGEATSLDLAIQANIYYLTTPKENEQ
ncbi:MAG TPA: type 4a pilus biogenesis protein PilO [Nevskiaceae bacterium]|nr:type 4a pilus biogenesis protein PilO [Nevskiaceae bacterium]